VPALRASASDDEPLRVRSAAKRHSWVLLALPAPVPALPSMTTRGSPLSALEPAAALVPVSPAGDALAEVQHRGRRAARDSAQQAACINDMFVMLCSYTIHRIVERTRAIQTQRFQGLKLARDKNALRY
jgi:hypothetical protein